MRRVIHKQAVPIAENFILRMPQNAKVLSVATIYDRRTLTEEVYVWYSFHPNDYENMHKHQFRLGVTGHEFNVQNDDQYVGTFFLENGDFVGHLYHEGSIGGVFRDPGT